MHHALSFAYSKYNSRFFLKKNNICSLTLLVCETENPNLDSCFPMSFFMRVDLPEPEGPQKTTIKLLLEEEEEAMSTFLFRREVTS